MIQDVKITKEKFLEYEKLRIKGDFNMLSPLIQNLTSLTNAEHLTIIKNYDELKKQFLK